MGYIIETFPVVKRKDGQKYGEYRTKRVILECYDALAVAMKTGVGLTKRSVVRLLLTHKLPILRRNNYILMFHLIVFKVYTEIGFQLDSKLKRRN